MNYKLHYAPLDLNGQDIQELSFDSAKEISLFISSIILPAKLHSDRVYVCTFPQDEIIVSENPFFILSLFENNSFYLHNYATSIVDNNGEISIALPNEYFLQEYETYEEAYKVALDMREPNPLCYNK